MTAYRALHLPPGFTLGADEIGVAPDPWGPSLEYADLSQARLEELMALLRSAGETELPLVSADRVLVAVDRVARRFLDPGWAGRSAVLEDLVTQAGLSLPMAKAVLDGMSRDWTQDRLVTLLESEFPDPGVLDGFRPGPAGTRTRAVGFPLTFHLGAGTVPGVSVTSLVRSLLVRSAVLLKPGRGDVVLPVVFARALMEVDPILAQAVAVVYWPREASLQTEVALAAADVAVVYGGDDTVAWARSRLPPQTPLVAFRHRMGIGVVGRGALGTEASATAHEAARAVALFDQKGCVSPQVCFVEEGGEAQPREWAKLLAAALEGVEEVLPSGRISPEDAVAVQQLRGRAEAEEGSGRGVVYHGGRDAPWTVVYEPDGGVEPTCLHRTVRIVPVGDVMEVPPRLKPASRYLQTFAVAGLGERRDALAEELARIGVSRLTSFGRAPWPPAWWHHDGLGPLRVLVRWTDVEEG